MNSALGMLGLALRAGRLAVGEDAAGDACRSYSSRLLLTAKDAAENTRQRAARFADEGRCILLECPWSKEEMGAALGRGACAVAAVTDLGMAQAVVEKLAAADAGAYGPAAQRLELKAERAAQRKKQRRPRKSK